MCHTLELFFTHLLRCATYNLPLKDPIPDIDLASDDEEMPPTPIKQAAAAKPAANTPVDPEEITADMGRLSYHPSRSS